MDTDRGDNFTTAWHSLIPFGAAVVCTVQGVLGLRNRVIGISTRYGSEFIARGSDAVTASWCVLGAAMLLFAAGVGIVIRERTRHC